MMCDSECDFVKDPERSLTQLKLCIKDRMECERKINVSLTSESTKMCKIPSQ